ncbi:hypothetical protein I302_103440 [Kwoniella bestiolae CBS 10118]|uniref:Protein phosphatase n=1 Tax=Kwoniella bestiolae CBS 10118 TaxID=1296100 RepID=A0A1B9G8F0_9TREE|nr:hypothetical protein I302_02140 [Kwoniella bestiolae CBS 10118]OCF27299.1 hypothetical protein I302_02140 [Kwoniella bestiolae CBS 10118]
MSKPKPGLGKGLVRNLTVSQYHPSSSGIITLAPVIGQHPHTAAHSYSTHLPPSASNHNGPITSSKHGWPNNPSNSSISLLPTWDQPSDIVLPYQPIPSRIRLKSSSASSSSTNQYTTNHSRRYSSLSVSPSAFLTSPIPPSLFFDKSLSFHSPPSATSPAQISLEALLTSLESSSFPSNAFDNLPPDPPSSPSASASRGSSPHQPLKTLRDVESHTVLSPTPLSISSDSNDTPSHSFASNPLLGLNEHSSNPPYDYPLTNENDENVLPSTYSSTLIFHLGCSGLPKERLPIPSSSRKSRPPTPPRQRSFPLPHVDPPTALKSVGVGEDAYFARSDGLCIADGVGGWSRSAEKKADPGRWSRLLTHFVEEEVNDWWVGKEYYLAPKGNDIGGIERSEQIKQKGKEKEQERPRGWARESWEKKGEGSKVNMSTTSTTHTRHSSGTGKALKNGKHRKERRPIDPVEIMQRGFEKCLSCINAEGIHGSSTCLLALLHNSTLHIANLGDCCLLLIRKGEVVFRTQEMQHAFNFPLQVGTHSRDEPMKDAQRHDVSVKKGDVVILGSDGLMDNLFDEDILEIVLQFTSSSSANDQLPTPPSTPSNTTSFPPFSPQQISEALCRRARSVSELVTATTPFMCKAIEEGIDFVGGKKDDISVLVGVIGDREDVSGNGEDGQVEGELKLHL